jgi:serine-type D-Ala-D-Ala carboxypeptidase/endopeptidase (penicillin-binding protein 4)
MKKIFLAGLLFIVFTSLGFAQTTADTLKKKTRTVGKATLNELQKDIDALLDSPDISSAFIGLSFFSLETGEYFYRKQDNHNFIPASLLKLLTSAAAFEYLGEDFRFTTRIYLNGYLANNGEYVGDIIIRASGDPTISKNFYKEPMKVIDNITYILDSLGIKSISGNIIGDDNYFDDEYYSAGWSFDDFNYSFSPQISAFAIYDNKIDINLKPAEKINNIADYYTEPISKYVQIINNVNTVPAGKTSDVSFDRQFGSNIIELDGKIMKDSLNKEEVNLSVTIDNPTLYFLSLFKDCIEKRNIKFKGALVDIDDYRERINYSELNQIYEINSPPLKEIIKVLNKQSNNLIAEVLLKTMAKENLGEGSFSKGTEMLNKFAGKIGITSEKANFADGSGLSRLSLITPKYIIALLSYCYRADFSESFFNSLAIPGENGTLKRRLTKSTAQKNIWAKTGSMTGVNNLAGYIKTKDNDMLAFSIMIMNFTVPQNVISNIIDLICMRISAFTRKSDDLRQ